MSHPLDVKLTTLDRLIEKVAPGLALKRMKARMGLAMVEKWNGGSRTRREMRNFSPGIGSADADTLFDLELMRSRSRDLNRNSPLAGGAINTVVTNAVGRGLTLNSRIDFEYLGMTEDEAAAWEDQAERLFNLWAGSPDCDLTRTQTFYQLQGLVFRSVLESGDCFTIPVFKRYQGGVFGLKVQVIEADRVSNKDYAANSDTLAGGVETDANGAPVRYHISTRHPGAISPKGMEWTTVDAFTPRGTRKVLHHFDRTRPGQSRGVPYLAPVIETLKQLERYTEAELMAAVVSGMFTVFITTEAGNGGPSLGIDGNPAPEDTGSSKPRNVDLGNGAIVDLRPGESVSTANPGRPNAAFDPFVLAILRQVGVRLELPYEVLVKHFTSSYTAARAALLDAWRFFMGRRDWLAQSLCQPYYEAFLEEAIALGLLAAPGFFDDPAIRAAYCGAEWIGDAQGQVDPTKEVAAARERVDAGFSTIETETVAMNGGDWRVNHRQQVRERAARVKGGLIPEALAPSPRPAAPPTNPDTEEGAP